MTPNFALHAILQGKPAAMWGIADGKWEDDGYGAVSKKDT